MADSIRALMALVFNAMARVRGAGTRTSPNALPRSSNNAQSPETALVDGLVVFSSIDSSQFARSDSAGPVTPASVYVSNQSLRIV